MGKPVFTQRFRVRDYECDLQGIVNNAVYQNYLEHARHEFFRERGVSFAELTARGIFVVVARVEMDFLSSLASGDDFEVRIRLERPSPLRFVFVQDIFKVPDQKPVLRGRVMAVARDKRGKPCRAPELEVVFDVH